MRANEVNFFPKDIENHRGFKILETLRMYGVSGRILSGNAHQLRHLINLLEDPLDPARVRGWDRRPQLQGLFDEVVRHFHNYLASIKTLVDHTRNLMREDFVKADHKKEYQARVNEVFAVDPFAQFMQDFRDYMTHYTIPIVGLSRTFDNADFNPAVLDIDLNHLKKWSGWTQPSKRFIEEKSPKVRLLMLVDDYESKVKEFQPEIGKSFERHYGVEISEALALIQNFKARLEAKDKKSRDEAMD